MPASVIAVAEADVEMVSLDTRAERQRQLIRHAQELHHLNLAAARQGLRERTAQADTAKVHSHINDLIYSPILNSIQVDVL